MYLDLWPSQNQSSVFGFFYYDNYWRTEDVKSIFDNLKAFLRLTTTTKDA